MSTGRRASAGRSSRPPRRCSCATATWARAWTRSPRSRASPSRRSTSTSPTRSACSLRSSPPPSTRSPIQHDEVLELGDTGDLERDLRGFARRQLRARDATAPDAAAPARDRGVRPLPPARPPVLRARAGRTIDALAAMFERLASRGVLGSTTPAWPRRTSTGWSCRSRSTRRCCSATTTPRPRPSSTATPTPASARFSRRTANADIYTRGMPPRLALFARRGSSYHSATPSSFARIRGAARAAATAVCSKSAVGESRVRTAAATVDLLSCRRVLLE